MTHPARALHCPRIVSDTSTRGRGLVIRVIHIGVSVKAKGGVASVIGSLLTELGRDPDFRASAIATTMWNERGAGYDVLMGLTAFVRTALACFRSPRPILHLHMSSHGSALRKGFIARFARLVRVPCVVHDHNVQKYFNETSRAMRWWIRGTFRRANAVVTITDREREFVRSLTAAPVETVRNAIYLPAPIGRPLAATDQNVHFLFLGKLMEAKGIFDLLEAFALLSRTNRAISLTLAGNGAVERVREWARTRNLQDRIEVPGWVEGEEKDRLLRAADVVVLPSYKEGLPVAVIEAMAYGLPVIAAAVGGIPEMVVENETGLLVKPRDVNGLVEAMRRLASDPQMRHRFGFAARKKAEDSYSLPSVCARLKEIYRKLVAT